MMPVSVRMNHAIADGYLVANVFHTNIPSIKTAEAIGMHFDKEYPDEANEITHVSVIYREDI